LPLVGIPQCPWTCHGWMPARCPLKSPRHTHPWLMAGLLYWRSGASVPGRSCRMTSASADAAVKWVTLRVGHPPLYKQGHVACSWPCRCRRRCWVEQGAHETCPSASARVLTSLAQWPPLRDNVSDYLCGCIDSPGSTYLERVQDSERLCHFGYRRRVSALGGSGMGPDPFRVSEGSRKSSAERRSHSQSATLAKFALSACDA